MYKTQLIFKDRSLRFYEMSINNFHSIDTSKLKEINYFEDEKLYLFFIAQLFNIKNVFFKKYPHLFYGKIKMPRRDVHVDYLTLDIYYFLNFIYMTTKRENRESLFQYFFNGKVLNTNNVNIFLNNINRDKNIFQSSEEEFLTDAIYTYKSRTIKTKIIKIEIDTIESIMKEEERVHKFFTEFTNSVDGEIGVKAFSQRAKRENADIQINHDSFFRLPLGDRKLQKNNEDNDFDDEEKIF